MVDMTSETIKDRQQKKNIFEAQKEKKKQWLTHNSVLSKNGKSFLNNTFK